MSGPAPTGASATPDRQVGTAIAPLGLYLDSWRQSPLLFGTYRCPRHEPDEFGIQEPISRGYFGQMLHPFKARKD